MAIDNNFSTHLLSDNIETTKFRLEANAHVFQMLTTKVYNDIILAPIRELSTNAVDATIEAGSDRTFDVHLPTQDELYFSVRDYGTGLSEEAIKTMYTTMGASTKRESNAYNGQFGIGKLAPLAYTSSFTIDSYYNAVHSSYLITLKEGIPVYTLLSSVATTEPNGLKLTLPVKLQDINTFHDRAVCLYKYFDLKPTLNIDLDISTPLASQFCDDWYFHSEGYNSFVLMANVRYAIDTKHFNTHYFNRLILKMPTGSVSITPGRESLSYDDKTIATIQAAYDNVLSTSLSHAQAYINKQTTPYQQLLAFSEMVFFLPAEVARQLVFTDPTVLSYVHTQTHYRCAYALKPSALGCSFKLRARRHNKSRSIDSFDIQDLNYYTIVLCDTNQTQQAVDIIAKESDKHLLVLTRSSGSLPDFISKITAHLDALQLPYVRTSAYAVPEKAKTKRIGIYYLHYTGSQFMRPTKAVPNKTYLYVPLSGYTVTSDYEKYLEIFRLMDKDPTRLIGIQQKYLAEAQANPNFQLLDDSYIETLRLAGPYILSERCANSPSCDFIATPLPDDVPSICKLHLAETIRLNKHRSDPLYRNMQCKPLFDYFDIPYSYTTTTVTHEHLAKYPLYDKFNKSEDFIYYLKLEHIRELHSNLLNQRTPVHDT